MSRHHTTSISRTVSTLFTCPTQISPSKAPTEPPNILQLQVFIRDTFGEGDTDGGAKLFVSSRGRKEGQRHATSNPTWIFPIL